jgi:enoyl-CoA hydratase
MADPVTYRLDGSTAVVQMDDGKANGLSVDMIEGLIAALTRAESEAKAIVLAGRPERFCAGFDLRVMMSGPGAAKQLLGQGSELLMRLYETPLPLVIACTGHALAGGALVVLTGDVRIGTVGAYRIGLNEVSIGMPVPVLAMELARDRLSKREVHHATLGARIYDPEHAVRAGYLDEAVAPDAVLSRAKEEATRLAAYGRMPYRATKERLRGKTIDLIRNSLESDLEALLPS